MFENQEKEDSLHPGTVFSRWWPLALSWLLMAVAVPIINAVIARLPNQEIHLSAYGSYVLPLGLVFESPILMVLAASTALCKNWASHRRVWKFMMYAGGTLTLLHGLVAFTPLSQPILVDLMGAPEPIVGPARIGLMITLPWTWSIAYRRFHQGVLIRFGHSKIVGKGAFLRVGTICLFLAAGYYSGSFSGVVVGTVSHAAGVILEAAFIGIQVRSVRREELVNPDERGSPPSWRQFFRFYTPLALTSILTLMSRPLLSAGIARMPIRVDSLAVFPVILGLIFLLRSAGMAYKEVVVSLLEEPDPVPALKTFTGYLVLGVSFIIVFIAATPLATLWFQELSGLKPDLVELGETGLWIVVLVPGLTILMNAYQGILVFGEQTRGIIESILLNLLTMGIVIGSGILFFQLAGLYSALIALTAGLLVQTAWLKVRSQSVIETVMNRSKPLQKNDEYNFN